MESDPDRPPFFKSWKGVYLLVVGFLIGQILLFSILTQAYQ